MFSRSSSKHSSLSQLIIKTGIIKTETGAQIVLLIVSVMLLITASTLFMRANVEPPAPTPEQTALD
jgi:hypothetical protein